MFVFGKKFETHVENFLRSLKLSWNSHIIVAVSGGIDSMALLHFANQLKIQGKIVSLRAIHIHHATRAGQDDDEAFVTNFCESLGVDLLVKKIDWDENFLSNFEMKARDRRYRIFNEMISPNEVLWTAHHLDDSLEWSLMQKFKTSNPASSLGIPVATRLAVRPFMCVSKKHILRYAKCFGINFNLDPTNSDLKFERNRMRKTIGELKKTYPKMLKHYVNQQNFWATQMNKNILKDAGIVKTLQKKEATLFRGSDLKLLSPVVVAHEVHRLSDVKRGQIQLEVKKFLNSITFEPKGPHSLTGGVTLWSCQDMLIVASRNFFDTDKLPNSKAGSLLFREFFINKFKEQESK